LNDCYNNDKQKVIRIKIYRTEAYGMTWNEMIQSGIGRHQKERKELSGN
jgi:hypothetical protein